MSVKQTIMISEGCAQSFCLKKKIIKKKKKKKKKAIKLVTKSQSQMAITQ
jgi:hypothetical protein